MSATVTIDTTGLNQLLNVLHDSMIAYGDKGSFRDLMRDQAGLLAKDISIRLGPKTQAKGVATLGKEVGKAFAEITVPVFPVAQRGNGKGPLEFLFATKKKVNYLVGVDGASTITAGMDAAALSRQSRRNRGVKWQAVGRRGKQFVVKLNRYLVQRGRRAQLVNLLKNRVGRMRATFAYAAHALGRTDTPGWVSRHFSTVRSEGRAIFDMGKLKDKNDPQIVFGSTAPGIQNFAEMIETSVAARSRKIADRTAAIIKAIGKKSGPGYQPEP